MLAQLHERINAHPDREEATAVPLMRTPISVPGWDAMTERAVAETGRKRVPTVDSWYAGAADEELRADALATVPMLVRVLLRLFGLPACQRRARRIHGEHAPASVG